MYTTQQWLMGGKTVTLRPLPSDRFQLLHARGKTWTTCPWGGGGDVKAVHKSYVGVQKLWNHNSNTLMINKTATFPH
jgi:hypothetical protein